MKRGVFARSCTPFRPSSFHKLKIEHARVVRSQYAGIANPSIQISVNVLPTQLQNETITKQFCKRLFVLRFDRTPSVLAVQYISVVESTATIVLNESALHAKRFSLNEILLIESARDRSQFLRIDTYSYEELPPPGPEEPPPF